MKDQQFKQGPLFRLKSSKMNLPSCDNTEHPYVYTVHTHIQTLIRTLSCSLGRPQDTSTTSLFSLHGCVSPYTACSSPPLVHKVINPASNKIWPNCSNIDVVYITISCWRVVQMSGSPDALQCTNLACCTEQLDHSRTLTPARTGVLRTRFPPNAKSMIP